MDQTPNLELPYLMAAQAQKHVTHNEAIRALDAIVQLSVLDRDLTAPPATPVDGNRYIVGAASTGDWSGKDYQLTAFQDNAWMFYAPVQGWICWVADEDKLLVWDGVSWVELSGSASVNPAPLVGINTTADSTNRLAVSSANTLLSHEGSDHRVKINKASVSDTASFLFQDNWSGRAEIGLAGDDEFHFKVSGDGSSWHEAITIDKDTGALSFPSGFDQPPQPINLTANDIIYIDSIAGNDSNDGSSAALAVKTVQRMNELFTVGRTLKIYILNDLVWDQSLIVGYVVPKLEIYGRTPDNSGWEERTITVEDSTNNGSYVGGFALKSFANVYLYQLDINLVGTRSRAFMNFLDDMAYLRTKNVTVRRPGTGNCKLFASGASYVPSQHGTLTIDASAQGYIANGVTAGADPNDDWRYPSNVTSM
ncbi:MAG: DUF2793 domain-containing protein [bacterium]|nr:DUF2793 domain-containing protein [bacterium]